MNRFMHSSILIGLTATLMTGCGFSPMHGQYAAKNTTISSEVSQVGIDIIPDRAGQSLRNNLIDRLYRSGYPSNPIATLKVSQVIETRTELDLTKSADATRAQLRLTSIMNLVDNKGSLLLTRQVQAVTSFNILGSEFATRVTEEAARESALNDLARQIELNLSLYYNSK